MEYEDQINQTDPTYECLLFDLDDTLYPRSGLSKEIIQNIQEYMIEKLKMEEEKVPELCVSLYRQYGTTMAGLKAIGYNFDYDDFHSCVHGILPYDLLKPDPFLRNLLLGLPVRKVIRTSIIVSTFCFAVVLRCKRMGLHTVRCMGVHYALESIHNIREALPELWEAADEKAENILHAGEVPAETTVIA